MLESRETDHLSIADSGVTQKEGVNVEALIFFAERRDLRWLH